QGGGTVKAVITVGPKNYVVNPSIEDPDMSSWELHNASRSPEAASAGAYAIHFWNRELVTVKQTVTNLPSGKYRLMMRSRIGANADPIGEAFMYAEAGGVRKQADLTTAGWSTWLTNEIADIEVRGGTVVIGVEVHDAFEAGGDFDEWELIRTGDLPGSGNSGNTGGSGSRPAAPSAEPDSKVVTNPQPNAEGKSTVSIEDGEKRVLLPANAAAIDGKHAVVVEREDVSVEIPGEVLAALQALADGEIDGATISLGLSPLTTEEKSALLAQSERKSGAVLTAAGGTFVFELAIVDKDGNATPLRQFDAPITLRLAIDADANPDLIGLYYIAEDGTLE